MLCLYDKYLLCLVCIGFAYIIYILQDSYNTLFFNDYDNLLTDTIICNSYTWYPLIMYNRPSVYTPSVDFIVVVFKMACCRLINSQSVNYNKYCGSDISRLSTGLLWIAIE